MKIVKLKAKVLEKEKRTYRISTEFIRLDAALKLCDAVMSGGHAKIVIQEGDVKVNNEVCLQRGKKIHPGDTIEFENVIYEAIEK